MLRLPLQLPGEHAVWAQFRLLLGSEERPQAKALGRDLTELVAGQGGGGFAS